MKHAAIAFICQIIATIAVGGIISSVTIEKLPFHDAIKKIEKARKKE